MRGFLFLRLLTACFSVVNLNPSRSPMRRDVSRRRRLTVWLPKLSSSLLRVSHSSFPFFLVLNLFRIDEAQRKRIEALNSLSSFVYGLKTQLGDQEGLGGKISDDDKKIILNAVKETTDWIDDNGSSASVEDLEEKLAGEFPFHTS